MASQLTKEGVYRKAGSVARQKDLAVINFIFFNGMAKIITKITAELYRRRIIVRITNALCRNKSNRKPKGGDALI